MSKDMRQIAAIGAALLVLFTTMIDPRLSFILAILLLIILFVFWRSFFA